MAKAIKPHYVYLGTQKIYYLSYAFCSVCNAYLGHVDKVVCPKCKENINWENVPYLKPAKEFVNKSAV